MPLRRPKRRRINRYKDYAKGFFASVIAGGSLIGLGRNPQHPQPSLKNPPAQVAQAQLIRIPKPIPETLPNRFSVPNNHLPIPKNQKPPSKENKTSQFPAKKPAKQNPKTEKPGKGKNAEKVPQRLQLSELAYPPAKHSSAWWNANKNRFPVGLQQSGKAWCGYYKLPYSTKAWLLPYTPEDPHYQRFRVYMGDLKTAIDNESRRLNVKNNWNPRGFELAPRMLIASIIAHESRYNPNARGAQYRARYYGRRVPDQDLGLGQTSTICLETVARFEHEPVVATDPFCAAQNIAAVTRHLAEVSWHLMYEREDNQLVPRKAFWELSEKKRNEMIITAYNRWHTVVIECLENGRDPRVAYTFLVEKVLVKNTRKGWEALRATTRPSSTSQAAEPKQ